MLDYHFTDLFRRGARYSGDGDVVGYLCQMGVQARSGVSMMAVSRMAVGRPGLGMSGIGLLRD